MTLAYSNSDVSLSTETLQYPPTTSRTAQLTEPTRGPLYVLTPTTTALGEPEVQKLRGGHSSFPMKIPIFQSSDLEMRTHVRSALAPQRIFSWATGRRDDDNNNDDG